MISWTCVQRVREGAVLVLVALVPSDDDGREHFMRAHTTPTKSPSKGSAKKKGANGVLAKEHEEGADIRAVGCLSRGLMEQKSLLVLDRVNAMGALKALLRQDADNRWAKPSGVLGCSGRQPLMTAMYSVLQGGDRRGGAAPRGPPAALGGR